MRHSLGTAVLTLKAQSRQEGHGGPNPSCRCICAAQLLADSHLVCVQYIVQWNLRCADYLGQVQFAQGEVNALLTLCSRERERERERERNSINSDIRVPDLVLAGAGAARNATP